MCGRVAYTDGRPPSHFTFFLPHRLAVDQRLLQPLWRWPGISGGHTVCIYRYAQLESVLPGVGLSTAYHTCPELGASAGPAVGGGGWGAEPEVSRAGARLGGVLLIEYQYIRAHGTLARHRYGGTSNWLLGGRAACIGKSRAVTRMAWFCDLWSTFRNSSG